VTGNRWDRHRGLRNHVLQADLSLLILLVRRMLGSLRRTLGQPLTWAQFGDSRGIRTVHSATARPNSCPKRPR
jgi:hypothetical protein